MPLAGCSSAARSPGVQNSSSCQRPAVTPQRCFGESLPLHSWTQLHPSAGPSPGCRGAQRGEEMAMHSGCGGEGAEVCFSAVLAAPSAQRPQSSAGAAPAPRGPGRCWGCTRGPEAGPQCPGKDRRSRQQQHENAGGF